MSRGAGIVSTTGVGGGALFWAAVRKGAASNIGGDGDQVTHGLAR